MPKVAFAVPIYPDKAEEYKRFIQELQGTRRDEYVEARRNMGIRKVMLWVQHIRGGDLLITYYECEDLDRMVEGLSSSQRPFDVWFRDQVKKYHGVALERGPGGSPPELILEVETG
jgi:L-rhamnose mutarotase